MEEEKIKIFLEGNVKKEEIFLSQNQNYLLFQSRALVAASSFENRLGSIVYTKRQRYASKQHISNFQLCVKALRYSR